MILLDIEGTTTPISFVTGTLVPYARAHLRAYLDGIAASPQYRALAGRFRREYDVDAAAGRPVPAWADAGAGREGVEAYAAWLMDQDRKSPALKDLQGRVWEEGYRSGAIVAPVYADVAPALARWRAARHAIGIFSSGSVLAQQWLFRCSSAGDLTPHLRWYFDTSTGPKQEATSYARIARETGEPAGGVLFVSDVAAELDAARAAGMRTALSLRPGNQPQPPHDHRVVTSFDDLS